VHRNHLEKEGDHIVLEAGETVVVKAGKEKEHILQKKKEVLDKQIKKARKFRAFLFLAKD